MTLGRTLIFCLIGVLARPAAAGTGTGTDGMTVTGDTGATVTATMMAATAGTATAGAAGTATDGGTVGTQTNSPDNTQTAGGTTMMANAETATTAMAPANTATTTMAPANTATTTMAPPNTATTTMASANTATTTMAPPNTATTTMAPANTATTTMAPANTGTTTMAPANTATTTMPPANTGTANNNNQGTQTTNNNAGTGTATDAAVTGSNPAAGTATIAVNDAATTQASETPVDRTEKSFNVATIDSSNIGEFASQLDAEVPPSQLEKLDKSALANVSNVLAINIKALSDGGQQVITRLIKTNVADAVAAGTVDVDYIAGVKDYLDENTLKSLNTTTLKTVVKDALSAGSTKFCEDEYSCDVWGNRMCAEIKNDCDFFADVSNSNFMERMKPKCFSDAVTACGAPLVNQTGLKLPLEGKRFLLKQAGINVASASDPGAEIRKVAPSLRAAISADDLAKVVTAANAAEMFTLISEAAEESEDDEDRVRRRAVVDPQKIVLAKLAKSTTMTNTMTVALAKDDLFAGKDYVTLKTAICNALSLADIKAGKPPAGGNGFCAVYENCKAIWGAPTAANAVTRYGPLISCAPDTTLDTVLSDTSTANFMSTLEDLDEVFSSLSQGKRVKLGMIVQKRLNSSAGANDLKSNTTIEKFKRFLPYVSDIGTRFDALTSDEKAVFCEKMGMVDLSLLGATTAHVITNKCVQNGGPLRKQIEGAKESTGIHFLDFLTADDIGNGSAALVTCAQVVNGIDLVAEGMVLDCAARKKIYQCYRDSVSSINDESVLDLMGSFAEYFSDADWTSITDSKLCGMRKIAPIQFDQMENKRLYRKIMGGFEHSRCDADGWKRAIKKLTNACKPSSRRRKRTTAAYTCDEIEAMGMNVEALATTDLSGMADAEIESCIPFLGAVASFSADHWTTLATKAKTIWGEAGNWTTDNLLMAGGIVSGLTPADIDSLTLDNLGTIAAAGNSGVWSSDKLARAFSQVKADKFSGNVSAITEDAFYLMGDLTCGATTDDIKTFSVADFCNAAYPVGLLETCETSQLVEMAALIKKDACLGSDVSAWLPNQAASIGAIVGGLSKNDLATLPVAAVAQIKPYVIAQIPTENINGFTKEQLGAMDSSQANSFTSTQLDSLDADKKDVINAQASVTRDGNGNGDGNGDGADNGCGLPEASVILIAITMVTALLRI